MGEISLRPMGEIDRRILEGLKKSLDALCISPIACQILIGNGLPSVPIVSKS